MTPLNRIISKLRHKLRKDHTFDDFLVIYDEGNFADAYTLLCDLIDKQPELQKIGGVYIFLAALELAVNDDAAKALKHLDRALELGDLDMVCYYSLRGDAMFEIGRHKEAVRNYEQAIAMDASVDNLMMLAQVLSEMDDSHAIDLWQQILDKNPQHCIAHIFVGLEAVKSGNLGKAMLMAKRAEKLNPSCDALCRIGLLYYKLEEFDSAINSYLKAIKLGYKDKGFLYACIAACYLSQNQPFPARKYTQWAIGFSPEHDYVKEVQHEYERRYGNIKGEK